MDDYILDKNNIVGVDITKKDIESAIVFLKVSDDEFRLVDNVSIYTRNEDSNIEQETNNNN